MLDTDVGKIQCKLSTIIPPGKGIPCPRCGTRHILQSTKLAKTYQKILPDGSTGKPQPIEEKARARFIVAYLKLEQMYRESRNRARYWRLQRIINTPWMINAVAGHLTKYGEFEDL